VEIPVQFAPAPLEDFDCIRPCSGIPLGHSTYCHNQGVSLHCEQDTAYQCPKQHCCGSSATSESAIVSMPLGKVSGMYRLRVKRLSLAPWKTSCSNGKVRSRCSQSWDRKPLHDCCLELCRIDKLSRKPLHSREELLKLSVVHHVVLFLGLGCGFVVFLGGQWGCHRGRIPLAECPTGEGCRHEILTVHH
jgi:preprotein translocase subunit Sss1